jgi:hypothetical protein
VTQAPPNSSGIGFNPRTVVGYLLTPLVPPMILLAGAQKLPFWDAAGIIVLYWVFGFASIVVLGTPLLLLYRRLGWTGYVSFSIGGGVCAAITSSLVMRGMDGAGIIAMWAFTGAASGLVLRMTLFGFRRSG